MGTQTYVNDAGTWRRAYRIFINEAGTWRTNLINYYNDAGTWREGGRYTVSHWALTKAQSAPFHGAEQGFFGSISTTFGTAGGKLVYDSGAANATTLQLLGGATPFVPNLRVSINGGSTWATLVNSGTIYQASGDVLSLAAVPDTTVLDVLIQYTP